VAHTEQAEPSLPGVLRQVILREARGETSGEIIAATGRVSQSLVAHLESLIGWAGARALRQRSLVLTRRQHAWLVDLDADVSNDVTPTAAWAAAVAHLTFFVNLLESFIGATLTIQVLRQLWPDVTLVLLGGKESS
jgi:hypothetical protein